MMRYPDNYDGTISVRAERMVQLAYETGETIEGWFNNLKLIVKPGDKPEHVVTQYWRKSKRRHEEWLTSPAAKLEEQKKEEMRKRMAKWRAKPIKQFTLRDPLAWKTVLKENGEFVEEIKFAARWAFFTEQEMKKGIKFNEAVEIGERRAWPPDGLRGSYYDFLLSALIDCWIYGEELRRWHNKKIAGVEVAEKLNAQPDFMASTSMIGVEC